MNDRKIEYRLIRSSRKTVAIQITPEGEVLVRCPNRMKAADVQKFVDSKSDWIRSHLDKMTAVPQLPPFSRAEIEAFAQKALEVVPRRVEYYASVMDVTYGRITIRAQHSRWGSCSSAGNLNFNCLLVLAPPEVLDYVVIHELCHRRQMNHSARFWAEVEAVQPGYREHRKWLKDHGDALIGRLPK